MGYMGIRKNYRRTSLSLKASMGNTIVGGDLNSTMKGEEVQGRDGRLDSLIEYFIHNFEEINHHYVELVKITPITTFIYFCGQRFKQLFDILEGKRRFVKHKSGKNTYSNTCANC